MLSIRSCLLSCYLISVAFMSSSQVWTEDEIISRAENQYPTMRMAELEVAKQKALEKTAFNPEQPRFEIETPTDHGLGFEAEQEFDFPTVYTARSKWFKSQTSLAKASALLTKNELIRDIRLAYLEAQVAQQQVGYARFQDSLWNDMAQKSQRLFDNGEINQADLLIALQESSLIRISIAQANTALNNALSALSTYAGEMITEVERIAPLSYDENDTSALFYFNPYLNQQIEVDRKEIQVIRAGRLPGLLIGYLKAPEPDTEFRYRFKAGITVPIWQAQYSGGIQALKAGIERKSEEYRLQNMTAGQAMRSWLNVLNQTRQSLNWYERSGLTQRDQIIDVYTRLYNAGEVNYNVMLRNISEAFTVNDEYLSELKAHNEAIIQLEFLKGRQ